MKSSQMKPENFLIRWRNSENFIKMICQDKCWKFKIISCLSKSRCTFARLSPNPFPLFHYFTWRRIGEPISDRHFLYLSTLSRNSGNGFELRVSTLVEKVKHHLLQPCLPGESLLRNDTVTTIRLDFWKGELSHGDHIMTLYREWTTRRRVFLARCQ